jgi:hypothetical protein
MKCCNDRRGRIWGPLNFLVYLGLRQYDHVSGVRDARQLLAKQSANLLLKVTFPSTLRQPCTCADMCFYNSHGMSVVMSVKIIMQRMVSKIAIHSIHGVVYWDSSAYLKLDIWMLKQYL